MKRSRGKFLPPLVGLALGLAGLSIQPAPARAAAARVLPPPPPPPTSGGAGVKLPPPPPIDPGPGMQGKGPVRAAVGAPRSAAPAGPGAAMPASPPVRRRRGLTTISILAFDATQGMVDDAGETIAEALEWELNKSGRFRILSRHQFTREQNDRLRRIQADFAEPDARVPFMKLTCEEAFVSGSVRKQGDAYTITMFVVDLASEEKILIERASCYHPNAFRRVARDFSEAILDRVDIAAKVKAVTDANVVYLDPEDAAEGIRPGDQFALVKVSEPVVIDNVVIDPGEEKEYARVVVDTVLLATGGYLRATVELLKPGHTIERGDGAHLVPARKAVTAPRRRVLGVLPFGVVGGNQALEGFSAIVRQELVSRTEVLGFAVRDPRGLQEYKGTNEDYRVVCDALALDAIVQATLVAEKDALRVYARLSTFPQGQDMIEDGGSPVDGEIPCKVSIEVQPTLSNAGKVADAIIEAIGKARQEAEKMSAEAPPPPVDVR
ncbi:MAG: hypothetical protein JXP34_28375 [Planctomycetes bacterium]|nr:hypothetical protein [Planctomycetota bacterium]